MVRHWGKLTTARGIKDGPARLYRPNGDVESEEWYDFGSIRYSRTWYPNGQLRSEKSYERGFLVEELA